MKIFGHPVHIMLIHFPTALLPMDLACSLIYYFTKNTSFTDASFYALCGGVLMGWLAAALGALDLLAIRDRKPDVLKLAMVHGCLNVTVIMVYSFLAFAQYKRYPNLVPDSTPLLIVKSLCMVILIAGNFLGGSLILKHKVAVEKTSL